MVKAFDRQQAVTNAGHVVVLMGGHSAEREISLLRGEAVLQSLIRSGVRASKLDVDERIVEKLSALAPDFALNMLHGEGGEDRPHLPVGELHVPGDIGLRLRDRHTVDILHDRERDGENDDPIARARGAQAEGGGRGMGRHG